MQLNTWAVIGIDPGSDDAAWGLVRGDGAALRWGRVRKAKDRPMALSVAHAGAEALACGVRVIGAAIEDQFVKINPRAATQLAHQAGAWAEACRVAGWPVRFVPPSAWQAACLPRLRLQTTKARALLACQGLWRLTDLCEHEADALLLGRYAAMEHARRAWFP